MLLLADSGSTKTAWRLIDQEKKIHQFQTQGLHPLFLEEAEIAHVLEKELIPSLGFPAKESITELFFYGTGCSNTERQHKMKTALETVFSRALIKVESDLTGAARGLCGSQPGLAVILGTGSNSCQYDGKSITHQRPSLGYILGDEGSGAWIGKTLLNAHFSDELPKAISDSLTQRLKVEIDDVIEHVYRKPFPNRYLATYSKFVFQNSKNPAMVQLVRTGFDAFFRKQLLHYPNKELPLHATGSVAFFFSAISKHVAAEHGFTTGMITESPVAGLALYHLGEV